jgi:X-Pro dipeptidyl-peptidase
MPLFYDNCFVPRGYAFIAVDLPGTSRSDGFAAAGGPFDVGSAKPRRRPGPTAPPAWPG